MHLNITRSPLVRRAVAATALVGALAAPTAALASTTAVTPPATPCKSVTKNISYLTTAKVGAKPAKAATGCQTANAVTNTWMLRFKAHQQVQRFTVNLVGYRCSLVPTMPRNTQCLGGGVRIAFAAPTGG
jgi:hypothetical protein